MRSRETTGNRWGSLRRRLAGLFAQRQILIRANGRIRYLYLGGRIQVLLLAIAAVAGGWTVLTSVGFLHHEADMALRDRLVAEDRAAYRDLLDDVAAYERRFAGIAREIENNRNLMLSLVEQNTALQHSLATLNGKLREADRREVEDEESRRRLLVEIERIEGELKAAVARNGNLTEDLAAVSRRLSGAVEQRDKAIAERSSADGRVAELEVSLADLREAKVASEADLAQDTAALRQEIAGLRQELGVAREEGQRAIAIGNVRSRRIAELEGSISHLLQEGEAAASVALQRETAHEREVAVLQAQLDARLAERDRALHDRRRMAVNILSLESRLAGLEGAQEDAVARMIDHTVTQIGNLEKVVGLTGLELSGLLADGGADYLAQGGPFIAAPKPDGTPGEGLQASLAALDQHMNHWELLRDIMQRMPMSAPMSFYHVTGTFGKRRDPINDRWAMHYGLDLGGPMKSKVHSTAPGKVVVAGWMGRYGRMVEVDHGAGLRTRYGHLSKVSVTKGQEIGFGEEVGLLGSSGRSTGPHLHYEVIFNDKPMDPMNFIKAGQHVFQAEQVEQ